MAALAQSLQVKMKQLLAPVSCVLVGIIVAARARARRASRRPTKQSVPDAPLPLPEGIGAFIVVKLGGAAITVKTKLEQLDIFNELRACVAS